MTHKLKCLFNYQIDIISLFIYKMRMQTNLFIEICINEINFLILISDFFMQKIKKRKIV